jgi:hypothetical protein
MRQRNELKRATEKAQKEYFENTCKDMEFHISGHYDLKYDGYLENEFRWSKK